MAGNQSTKSKSTLSKKKRKFPNYKKFLMLSKRKVSRKNKKALKSALAIDEVKKSTLQEKTKILKTQDKVKKSTLQEKTNVKISVSQDKPIVEKSTLKTQKKSTLHEKSSSPREKTSFQKQNFQFLWLKTNQSSKNLL